MALVAKAGAGRPAGSGAHHRVIARLRSEIISGWRSPGSALGEVELADEYGVSRNPVREALRHLEAEGFVVSRPGRSTIVARLTEDEARGILEVRGILERNASRAAAERRSDEELTTLNAIVAQANVALAAGDAARLTELNTEFHLGVASAAGNVVMADIIGGLMRKVEWMYSPTLNNRGQHSWQEHLGILAAIEARDGDSAETLMADHICAATADFALKHAQAPNRESDLRA